MEEDDVGDAQDLQSQATGLRRAFTMRSTAARQVAINFMPSRQLPYNTLRLRRRDPEHSALLEGLDSADGEQTTDQQASIIVREMEQHTQLMEDNPEAEELRREALRDLAQGLTMKRHVRAKLSASVSNRSRSHRKPISVWKRFKYRCSFAVKRARDRFRNLAFSVELWYEAIRRIEGHFGSAVGSYFYFLRSLFALNVGLLALQLCFVVVPQRLHNDAAHNETVAATFPDFVSGKIEIVTSFRNLVFSVELWYQGHFGSAVGSYFYFLRSLFALNVGLLALQLCFVVVPQRLHNDAAHNETVAVTFPDFVSGKGYFEDSLLFYGHYHSGEIAAPGPAYDMAYAYFFTMACVYLLFFGVLCYRTAYLYRHNFIETGGGVRHAFASKVFSGWDFGIADASAAALNARSICNELKELLAEDDKKNTVTPLYTKIGHYLANIVLTALVLGFIGSVGYGIWILLSIESNGAAHWEIVVSAAITLVVCLSPLLFNSVVRLEYYAPRTALYVTLARTCLLDFGTLFLMLYFWSNSGADCWETAFGQETYRLVLLDAIFSLVLLPLFEFARGLVYKIHATGSPPEFNIAYNSLTLIYNQAVLWFGMLFSPLLVVAVAFKFLCLFYVKRAVAMYACQPARKVWRAAQTQAVMYMLVTLSLFINVFGIGSLFLSSTSDQCGPFQQYRHVYGVLTEGVLQLHQRPALRAALAFLTRPGVIGLVMVSLCVMVYYVRAKSLAQRSMVGILRQMLIIEAKDKDFLLAAITKVSNGEWLYNPKMADSTLPDTHTWKYLHDDRVRKPSNSAFAFDGSRLNHSVLEVRPRTKETRPNSQYKEGTKSFVKDDGDTDSSFSWKGSGSQLNESRGGRDWL